MAGAGRPGLQTGTAEATRRLFRWQFMQETWTELKKVEWPGREEATRLTMLVIVLSACVGITLGVIDLIFNVLVNRVLLGG